MRYGLALGSNMGDRLANLQRAKNLLVEHTPDPDSLAACSSIYETAPVDCELGAGQFYNACLEIELPCQPRQLLDLIRKIEIDLGRTSVREKNAPRPIDIDILYAGGEIVSEPDLQIPHPRIVERRFVLEPLREIRPEFVLPGENRSIDAICNGLESGEPPLILVARDW